MMKNNSFVDLKRLRSLAFAVKSDSLKLFLSIALMSSTLLVMFYPLPAQAVGQSPSLTGKNNVGSTLSLDVGTWDQGTTQSISWLRDGLEIPGASTTSLVLTSGDLGKSIVALVIGKRNGIPKLEFSNFVPLVETALSKNRPSTPAMGEISSGNWNLCAVELGGVVECVGKNIQGELGNGSVGESHVPTKVLGVNDAVSVATKYEASCAIHVGGTVSCWGANTGVTPYGSWAKKYPTPHVIDGLSNAVQVSIGSTFACAVQSQGQVSCWGALKDTSNNINFPSGPSEVPGLPPIKKISLGDGFACALDYKGSVYCWGNNNEGELGDGTYASTTVPVPVPVSNAIQISSGDRHTCAVMKDGSAECWGYNGYGQLGLGTQDYSDAPSKVILQPNLSQISAYGNNSCAITNSGLVFCWGNNTSPASTGSNSGAAADLAPQKVEGVADAREISGGLNFACALDSIGHTYCWGSNAFGQLSDGSTTDHLVPAPAVGFSPESIDLVFNPSILGSARVGETVTAQPGNNVNGMSFSYQWYSDDTEITGGTHQTYEIQSTDLGKRISFAFAARLPGYSETLMSSPALTEVLYSPLTLTPTPVLSGSPKVGKKISAVTGTWDTGVTNSFQWLRDGKNIAGAVSAEYAVTSSDFNHKVSVSVTGSRPGFQSTTRTSLALKAGLGVITSATFHLLGNPKKFGSTLISGASAWIAGARIGYQWLLDGKPIRGATSQTLKVVSVYSGHQVSLKVTESKLGYSPASKVSIGLKVG